MSDVTFDMQKHSMEVHESVAEPWKVTLVDTGDLTGTGGRLKKVAGYLDGDDAFCMTYGDGLSDIDIAGSVAFHREHGGQVTVTAAQPPAGLALSASMARQSLRFRKSQRVKADGLMADFSFCR